MGIDNWGRHEKVLWLCWRSHPTRQDLSRYDRLWREVVDFVVIDIIAKLIAPKYPEVARDYFEYAQAVKNDVLRRQNKNDVGAGKIIKGKKMEKLVRRWSSLGMRLAF